MKALLYEQLADELASLIDDGRLRPGDRLPSVRRLCQQRQLSTSTVVQALRTLEDRGQVEARPQAGFFVRRRRNLPEPNPATPPTGAQTVGINRLMEVLALNERPEMLPLGSAFPGAELLPISRLQRTLNSIVRRHPELFATGDHTHNNYPRLIRQIVRWSVEWGWPLQADELVITNGCSEALTLCLRAVAKPGDTVAVESPTHFVLLQRLQNLGLKALEIPTHPRDGVSVEALELAARTGAIQACLLMPNAHNPLGCRMPDDNKRRLAALIAECQLPVIEDDLYGELFRGQERPLPLKAYDTSGQVLLCSSFSKMVSTALRVGYIAAGRYAQEVTMLKAVASGATGVIMQAVLAEFMEEGGYDHQLRRLRRMVSQQVEQVSEAVAEYFPEGTSLARPQGGCVLWVELPQGIDTLELHRLAVRENMAFVPGPLFSVSNRYRNCLRLACGHPWTEHLDQGIRRLGQLANELLERG